MKKTAILFLIIGMAGIMVSCGADPPQEAETEDSVSVDNEEKEYDEFYYAYINPISSMYVGYSVENDKGEYETAYYDVDDAMMYTIKASCHDMDVRVPEKDDVPETENALFVFTLFCADSSDEINSIFVWDGDRNLFYPDTTESDAAYVVYSDTLEYLFESMREEIKELNTKETIYGE